MGHHVEHRPRTIAVLAVDGVRTLDLTGPLEVFDVARSFGCAYTVTLHSCSADAVRCSSGMTFGASPIGLLRAPVDTLLVVGGRKLLDDTVPQHLRDALRALSPSARRVAAIGTAVFALGAVGLLDGRHATTHWRDLDDLGSRHPQVRVDRESVYVRDGELWTSAGAAAGVDLALALVADDHGADTAARISTDMVVLSRRLEGHPQISVAARTPRPKHAGLERLMATIGVDPASNYELDSTAAQLGMSPRHLARLFKAQVGMTLRQYVHQIRLENAVALVLAGESFHAAARRSGLRYGASVRDHLAAHRSPRRAATGLLIDPGRAKPAPVHAG